jgi:hypothetical protein
LNVENHTAKDETKTTMVPAQNISKKNARSGDTGGTAIDAVGEKDIKRQRTDTASVNEECHNNNTIDPSHQDYSPDLIVSATGARSAATVTASSININDNKDLPTPYKLSEELCKIVDRVHYSRIEALLALGLHI